MSVKWWENFVNMDRGPLHLAAIKKQFHNTRITSGCVLSVIHIVVALASMYALDAADQYKHHSPFAIRANADVPDTAILMPDESTATILTAATTSSVLDDVTEFLSDVNTTDEFFQDANESMVVRLFNENPSDNATGPATLLLQATEPSSEESSDVLSVVPAVLCISASCVAYYLAGLASKLLMQKFSFALPAVLSSPVLVGIMYMKHYGLFGEVRVYQSSFPSS